MSGFSVRQMPDSGTRPTFDRVSVCLSVVSLTAGVEPADLGTREETFPGEPESGHHRHRLETVNAFVEIIRCQFFTVKSNRAVDFDVQLLLVGIVDARGLGGGVFGGRIVEDNH